MKLTVLPWQGDHGRTITLCDERSEVVARITPRNEEERARDADNFERLALFWNAAAPETPPVPRLDVAAACEGEWPWYVTCLSHTTSAVQRDGEWRLYFETIAELIATLDIPCKVGTIIDRMDAPSGDELASEDEVEEMLAFSEVSTVEIEVDAPAKASRADDAVWIQAWVRLPYSKGADKDEGEAA